MLFWLGSIYFHSKSDILYKCKKATYDLQEEHLYLFVSLGVVVEVSDSAGVERGTPPDDSVNLVANCSICVSNREIVCVYNW